MRHFRCLYKGLIISTFSREWTGNLPLKLNVNSDYSGTRWSGCGNTPYPVDGITQRTWEYSYTYDIYKQLTKIEAYERNVFEYSEHFTYDTLGRILKYEKIRNQTEELIEYTYAGDY